MDAENKSTPPYRKDAAQAATAPSPSEPPPLDALTAAVQHSLAAMYTLSSNELRMAATTLRMLANIAEAMAQRRDR